MAKLYYDPDQGGIIVRKDDDDHGVDGLVEIIAEEAAAVGLSSIARAVDNLYAALENGLPGPR
jgi:hypothetical protein